MKPKSSELIKIVLLSAALSGLTTNIARADAEDLITKSYDVQPGTKLVVQLDRGSIEVVTGDANAVNIEITRRAGGSQSRAEKILKDHIVTTSQEGDTVELRGEYTGPKSTGWFGKSPDLRVSCRVTLPRKFDVNLRTSGGNISVGELTGKTEARTSGGSMKFEKLVGPLSARTSGGNIKVSECQGQVDVRTSGGSLQLADIEGDVTARTSGGSIQADQLNGRSDVRTSGGNIKLTDFKGQVDASTSGGSVSVRLIDQPTGDCSFKSSGGSVKVSLPENVAVDVDAQTSGGRASSDFAVVSTIQGKPKQNVIRGKINGGGPLIVAQTSGGNVQLGKN